MSTALAVVLLLAIVTYTVFGGADFGAGFWELLASDRNGKRPRRLIEHAIAPVWEANHVWLIFILVLLWTCFPEAYASIMLTLFVPLTLVALGVVMRGSGFAFRKAIIAPRAHRNFGRLFALSSVLVPYCMGAVAGGIASGRVPAGGKAGDPVDSWINSTSIVIGIFAVAVVAYLSAVYLVFDARRLGDMEMVGYFRRRSVIAAVVAGAVAVAGAFVLHSDAKYVFDGLTSRALPLVIVSGISGVAALLLLVRDATRGARALAALAVATVVGAWGVAQWPYILPTSLKVSQAAAPTATLTAALIVFGLLIVVVLPSLALALPPRPEEPPTRGKRGRHAPIQGHRHERSTAAPRRHRRWRVRRAFRGALSQACAGTSDTARPRQLPPFPTTALPVGDRHPVRRRNRATNTWHPQEARKRRRSTRNGDRI